MSVWEDLLDFLSYSEKCTIRFEFQLYNIQFCNLEVLMVDMNF